MSILPKDEWGSWGGKQQPQEDNLEDCGDIQRLTWDVAFALHGYSTSVCTLTSATPFSLVYRMQTDLPIKVKIPSLRVLMEVESKEAE